MDGRRRIALVSRPVADDRRLDEPVGRRRIALAVPLGGLDERDLRLAVLDDPLDVVDHPLAGTDVLRQNLHVDLAEVGQQDDLYERLPFEVRPLWGARIASDAQVAWAWPLNDIVP